MSAAFPSAIRATSHRPAGSLWRPWGLAGAILCALGSIAQAADWPQWLGPQRNGVSSESVAPWTSAPEVAWRAEVDQAFSSPVVAGGLVFIHATVKGADEEQVTAFRLETGEKVWNQSYPRAKYQSDLGNGPRATASVVGDSLITLGITGELVCFEAATGVIRWRCNPYTDHDAPLPGFGACSSPLVLEGRVVLPVGGAGVAIVAYDLETGREQWKALDEPAGTSAPVVWQRTPEGAPDLVVQTTLRLVGLNPADGTVRWSHPLVFEPGGVSPTPLTQGTRLICTTQDTGTLAIEAARDGSEPVRQSWWDQELTSYFSTGTVGADDRAFLVTNVLAPLPRADVQCVDSATGQPLWKQTGLGYFHIGVIALAENRLLILTDAGKLILADGAREGYRELCNAKVCRGTFCNPALVDGRLVVRDDREVVCVRLGPAQ